MKKISSVLALIAFAHCLLAQNPTDPSRSALNEAMYPFYHGVASGDPLTDRVIIWTRITLDPPTDPVQVGWALYSDTSLQTVVTSGNAVTDSSHDYTVKVDAAGLQPNTWYYYRFSYDTFNSVIGRTKTLPAGNISSLRMAVASCQGYQKGYYNAHKHLSERNDLDAVLFLGDYTYENGVDTIVPGRYHEPEDACITIYDYRIRQSQYHLDPDLQEAHRQYPWITVWDDHEVANNAYRDGAKNHDGNDGPWADRKTAGVVTYMDWMPIRIPDPNDTFRIYRRFTFGNLADLYMIDTRLYDRDQQAANSFTPVNNPAILDSTRTMVGPVQFNWLESNMAASTAQWQLLGQQVMMAPLQTVDQNGNPSTILNPDQWDGYPFERKRLYDFVAANSINNMVVLTGDIHTSWANDLPLANYDTSNRQNSAGVEFVATSISSSNDLPPLVSEGLIKSMAPYVRYVDLFNHGYYVLDINTTRTQTDYVFVSDVETKNYTVFNGESWYVNTGERFLRKASAPAAPAATYPPLAQVTTQATGIGKVADNITTISMYPNPFLSQVLIQYNTTKPEKIILQVYSAEGKKMMEQAVGMSYPGTNYARFDGSALPAGMYQVVLTGTSGAKGKALLKVN